MMRLLVIFHWIIYFSEIFPRKFYKQILEFEYTKKELDLLSPKNSIKLNDSNFFDDSNTFSSVYVNLAEIFEFL